MSNWNNTKHYLYGIKITLGYLVGWVFKLLRLKETYGIKLFHWTMPYAEKNSYGEFDIMIKRKQTTKPTAGSEGVE